MNYTLGGGLENLEAMGALGLSLAGNTAANSIEGSYGNDTLNCAGGADYMAGGGGMISTSSTTLETQSRRMQMKASTR